VAEALENRPARLERVPLRDTVVVGDASGDGYAGIVCKRRPDGSYDVTLVQHRWGRAARSTLSLDHSTNSEPEATIRLLDAATRLHPGAKVIYVTDHGPFRDAYLHGYSKSPAYNSRITRVRDRHPHTRINFQPGDTMIADKYSRFVSHTLSDADREATIALAEQLFSRGDVGREEGAERGGVIAVRLER
jgi:hypothetical protein